jgi:hypothetical protein
MTKVLVESYREIIQRIHDIDSNESIESFALPYNIDMSKLEINVGFTVSYPFR